MACFATAIFLSSCGNYAIVGFSSGHLDVFNMQSGEFKKSFYLPVAEQIETEEVKIFEILKINI